jgi:hypothetical protein
MLLIPKVVVSYGRHTFTRSGFPTASVILAKARIQVVTRAKRIMAALRAEGLHTGFQPSLE